MRILHVITTIELGGAEKQLLILVHEQVSSGHDVSVVYLKGQPQLADSFSSVGARVITSIANQNWFYQLIWLKNFSKRESFVIHAHLPQAEITASLIKNRNKFVISRHVAAQFIPRFPALISRMASLFVSSRSNEVIAISEAVKKYLIRSKEICGSKEIIVIHYGSRRKAQLESSASDDLRRRYNIAHDSFVIGTIARIVRQKDFPTLLKSFAHFHTLHPNSNLIILGDGNLLSQMQNFAQELEIAKDVIWVGKTSDINAYLSLIDVFAFTTLYEGFGLVLLEAMQMKVPIVASRNSSIPEVLGETYPYLIESGDFISFARSYSELLDPQHRDQISILVSERVLIFDSKKMASKVEAVYNQILQGTGGSR